MTMRRALASLWTGLVLVAGCGTGVENPASESTGAMVAGAPFTPIARQEMRDIEKAACDADDDAHLRGFPKLRPVVECVDKLPGGQYVAHFGYNNYSGRTQTVPVGLFPANLFAPLPIGRGQPTSFAPGVKSNVFQVTFSGAPIAWVLGPNVAVASRMTKLCAQPTVCPASCDDGNPCTADSCSAATRFQCVHTSASDGTSCDDGDLCNGAEVCKAGICRRGTKLRCEDGNSCTSDSCDPKGGCKHANAPEGARCPTTSGCGGIASCHLGACVQPPTSSKCDDHDPCTADSCGPGGTCRHTPVVDGTSCDDGNACNGKETCQVGKCVAGVAPVCKDTSPCTADSCDPIAGCKYTAVTDGTSCPAAAGCNATAACLQGVCQPKSGPDCNDNNPCTDDSCGPGGTCVNAVRADGSSCADNDACNGAEVCAAGQCQMGTQVTCTAVDACHAAGTCDPSSGKCSKPIVDDGTACDDGSACTSGDSCASGVCQSGAAKTCPALDACHAAGVCDPKSGSCSTPNVADGTSCADANACNGAESCQAGTCKPATPLDCDDHDPCTSDSCDAAGGCQHTYLADGTVCGGAVGCMNTSTCQNHKCLPSGPSGSCDKGNPCMVYSCKADGSCAATPKVDGTSCSDGDLCNGAETCMAGTCMKGTPVVCPAADQCHLAGTCDPKSGACSNQAKPNGTSCSDNNACTSGDSCQAGNCQPGSAKTCTASDQCHGVGTCNPSNGLCSDPPLTDGTSCDDKNLCTTGDTCKSGVCTAGSQKSCTASDQCHDAGSCTPATGLCSDPAKANGAACNDSDACTQTDTCQSGACKGSNPVVCTASDQCHDAGTCVSSTGQCSNPAKANGVACNDSDACTQTDTCQSGACKGSNPVVCTASDQCHGVGTCAPATGACSDPPVANGTACNDKDACTQTDTCQSGACVGGNPVVCTASDQCHGVGTCNSGTGVCSNPNAADGTSCSDGNACTKSDSCQAGACKSGAPVVCAAPDACHPGVCDQTSGACSNPSACTLYGVGAISGTASDHLVSPTLLEDGTPNDRVGAFGSAIAYTGTGYSFVATPDRGPNNGLDSYTNRYYVIDLDLSNGVVTPTLRAAAPLSQLNGTFTGIDTAFDATNSPASLRLDPEGVRVSPSGTFYVSDEYGPFLYEFDNKGQRLRALTVPSKFLIDHPGIENGELPPTNTKGRQANRGMEGLAISPDGQTLYGLMQSPLIQDGALDASNKRIGTNNRILQIDTTTGATHEYLYPMENAAYGLNEMLAVNDHQFLVIERDSKAGTQAAFKHLYLVDLTGASDISSIASLPSTGIPAGVTPVKKTLFLDLLDPAFGLAGASFPEKIEGLAFGPDQPDGKHTLVITNDNDFLAPPINPTVQDSRFFVFFIDPAALPGFQAANPSFVDPCPAVNSCPSPSECILPGICNPGTNQCSLPAQLAGTAVGAQVAGDCQKRQCDGNGGVANAIDNSDVPPSPSQCKSGVCTSGTPSVVAVAAGTHCSEGGGSLCDGSGSCVACLAASDCPGQDTECATRTCTAGACGMRYAPAGTATSAQTAGDCHQNQCDGSGNIVNAVDDTDVHGDNNQCTSDVCSGGVASNPPTAVGTPCGGGLCNGAGACVGCLQATDCPGTDTECGVRTCVAGVCGANNAPAGTPTAAQTAGDCHQSQCDGAGGIVSAVDNGDLPVDGNACTSDVCTNGAPSNPLKPAGSSCSADGLQACDATGLCAMTLSVLRVGSGAALTSGVATAVFIDQYRTDGTLIATATRNLPTATSGANQTFTLSGTATSEGGLWRSLDGRYLSAGGYPSAPGTTSVTSTLPRVIARIDAGGAIDTSTQVLSGLGGNNIRSAASIDGSGFWASGPGGIWYVPFQSTSSVQVNAQNSRVLEIFGSQLYGSAASGSFTNVFTVGSTPPPTSAAAITAFTTNATGASPYAYFLSDASTLYVADDRAAPAGGLQKYTKSGTVWTLASTSNLSTTPVGLRGLTGFVSGGVVTLYATTADAAENRLVRFVDGASSVSSTVLATSTTNTRFRGVAFSPHL